MPEVICVNAAGAEDGVEEEDDDDVDDGEEEEEEGEEKSAPPRPLSLPCMFADVAYRSWR